MRPSPHATLLLLLGFVLIEPGCEAVCGGHAWCIDNYPRARVAVHLGDRWSAVRSVWADADTRVDGTADDGSDWAVTSSQGDLFFSLPEVGRIVQVPLTEGISSLDPTWSWDLEEPGETLDIAMLHGVPLLAVGIPSHDHDAGAIAFLTDPISREPTASPTLLVESSVAGDALGSQVVPCPDATGTELAGWLVSAPTFSRPLEGSHADEDIPHLAGAIGWIASEAIDDSVSPTDIRTIGTLWWGDEIGGNLGRAIACGADVTGDGVPDLLAGAPRQGIDAEGKLWILDGANLPDSGPISEAAIERLEGDRAEGGFGGGLAVGDLDGDGIADVLVGEPGFDDGRGRALLFGGSTLTRGIDPLYTFVPPSNRTSQDHLGRTVAIADFDGDGHADVLVGTEDWSLDRAYGTGRLFVWRGPTDTWAPVEQASESHHHVIEGVRAFQRVGRRLHVADLDDDGAADLVIPTRSSQ